MITYWHKEGWIRGFYYIGNKRDESTLYGAVPKIMQKVYRKHQEHSRFLESLGDFTPRKGEQPTRAACRE
jgi:hypothetical protein